MSLALQPARPSCRNRPAPRTTASCGAGRPRTTRIRRLTATAARGRYRPASSRRIRTQGSAKPSARTAPTLATGVASPAPKTHFWIDRPVLNNLYRRHLPPNEHAGHSTRLGRGSITIESTFPTVRLRPKVTERPGSRAAGLAMAFKLIEPPRPLACGQRSAPHRPGPRRRRVPQRRARGAQRRVRGSGVTSDFSRRTTRTRRDPCTLRVER